MGLEEAMNTLSRLFSPKILAVIGGGEWCRAVVQQVQKFGYKGKVYEKERKRIRKERKKIRKRIGTGKEKDSKRIRKGYGKFRKMIRQQ